MARLLITVIATAISVAVAPAARPAPITRPSVVAVQTEPPEALRSVTRVTLRPNAGAGASVEIDVASGRLSISPNLACPCVIEAPHFEATTYDHLAAGDWPAAVTLRELGHVRGHLVLPSPKQEEKYVWLLQRTGETRVSEIAFTPDATLAFDVPLPAGIYHGVVFTSTALSRIRSAIVVKAGGATDVGTIACDVGKPLSVRILDAKSRRPITGARVQWDPPAELNAGAARKLFAERWSGVTDRSGTLTIPLLGPMPLPVRWRIEAQGYGAAVTPARQLRADDRFPMPDVLLHPTATVEVHVGAPAGTKLGRVVAALLAPADPNEQRHYRNVAATDVRDGVATFKNVSFGSTRIVLEYASGIRIAYKDFTVFAEHATVLFDLIPKYVHGRVSSNARPVASATVTASDARDASMILARTQSDQDGMYGFTTFQTGETFLYATPYRGPGTVSGFANKSVQLGTGNDYEVSFDLPAAGASIVVVDAMTGAPVPKALVNRRLTIGDHVVQGFSEADANGRLSLDGFAEGVAALHVEAPNYRARTVDVAITNADDETRVELAPSIAVTGTVVGPRGEPVPGARISGGYPTELAIQGLTEMTAGADGRFTLPSAPEIGTFFYIAAPGYALALAQLHPGDDNTIVLAPPTPTRLYLREGGAAPTTRYRVVAAPSGGNMIPVGALDDLAHVNGMEQFQLLGSAADGSVVLSEFLPPGTFDFFITRKGGDPFIYTRVGTVHLPGAASAFLDIPRSK